MGRERGSVGRERGSGACAKLDGFIVPRRFILWVINRSPLVNVFPVAISDLGARGGSALPRERGSVGAWERGSSGAWERGR